MNYGYYDHVRFGEQRIIVGLCNLSNYYLLLYLEERQEYLKLNMNWDDVKD